MSGKQMKKIKKAAELLTMGKPKKETEKVYKRLKDNYKKKTPK